MLGGEVIGPLEPEIYDVPIVPGTPLPVKKYSLLPDNTWSYTAVAGNVVVLMIINSTQFQLHGL